MDTVRREGAMYFATIAAAGPGRAVLTGHYYAKEKTDEQISAARLIENGTWTSLKAYTGIVHAVRHDPGAKLEFLLLERALTLYRVSAKAEFEFEAIREDRDGFLMDLRKIGTHWYTVGGQHQVLRQEGKKWRPIDEAIFLDGDEGDSALLQSIDGTSETDIYAVGTNGAIFHFDGKDWTEFDPPTDNDFERVLCVAKDQVYLCGTENTLYRGTDDAWLPLTDPDEATFWDMARFQGKVYVCSGVKLYVIEGDELEEVEVPIEGQPHFYRLDASDTDLWCAGGECVLQFNGEKWTQHLYPENQPEKP